MEPGFVTTVHLRELSLGSNAPCAMVPLNPNELSRPGPPSIPPFARATSSMGASNHDNSIEDR